MLCLARRSLLNPPSLALNALSLALWTFEFRRVPAPNPTPSDFTVGSYLIPNRDSPFAISLPSPFQDAVHTDLVLEISMSQMERRAQTMAPNPTTDVRTSSIVPDRSAERSSTYSVGSMHGYQVSALSMMRIIITRISNVANPLPAVMPRTALTEADTTWPILTMRFSL